MKRINRCLNNQLAQICKKSIQIESLNLVLQKYLPTHLKDHCFVASYEKNLLNLVARDAVWASELRFYLPELRDNLRTEYGFHQLIGLKMSVKQEEHKQLFSTETKEKKTLSSEGKEKIKKSLENCQFEPLQIILEKLLET